VDKALHVYGTPFFIAGELPIESELSKTSFRRLMIAQDTGSAIVGPARADLYFGAGADAGKVSGRLRHNMHFLMLVPKSIDPAARARRMPLPDPRPSEAIAKLLDQEKAEKEKAEKEKAEKEKAEKEKAEKEKAEKEKAEKEKAEKEKPTPADAMTTGPAGAANTTKAANDATSKPVEAAAPVAQPSATPTTTAPVPIPEPRPNIATGAEARRSLHHHPYRLSR